MISVIALFLATSADNMLTPAEAKAGWKLLFDGKTTKGWHNFKEKAVRPGWQVVEGVLKVADPGNAGDILTDAKFEWFELQLDVNIGKEQNSGVMFRVADAGLATWHSGPEIQIYDHPRDGEQQVTGDLYQLYPGKTDPSKPSGQWNHLRIVVAPKQCYTELNGVRLYEYQFGSADFWARVKKSKFSAFPGFAKTKKGSIAIQGDHGAVSFKNIKILPLK